MIENRLETRKTKAGKELGDLGKRCSGMAREKEINFERDSI